MQPYAVDQYSYHGWFANSDLNSNVTRPLFTQALVAIVQRASTEFGYLAQDFSLYLSSLLLHPKDLWVHLHWEERVSLCILSSLLLHPMDLWVHLHWD